MYGTIKPTKGQAVKELKSRAKYGAHTVAEWYRTGQIKPWWALTWAILTAFALWGSFVDQADNRYYVGAALLSTFMLSRYIGRFCACSCCSDDDHTPKYVGTHERIKLDK